MNAVVRTIYRSPQHLVRRVSKSSCRGLAVLPVAMTARDESGMRDRLGPGGCRRAFPFSSRDPAPGNIALADGTRTAVFVRPFVVR